MHGNIIKLFQEYSKKKYIKLKAFIKDKLKSQDTNSSDIFKIS